MWIAGPTLAIGYLNMPEKTAERFVPDPFAAAAGREGERMYDTGDRCRYLPSGSIEVIGRCDFMVKVRRNGYLISFLLLLVCLMRKLVMDVIGFVCDNGSVGGGAAVGIVMVVVEGGQLVRTFVRARMVLFSFALPAFVVCVVLSSLLAPSWYALCESTLY